MASSVSGQDEPNRALWLATRAGKMEPSCPLGTTRSIPQAKFHQKPYNKTFIDQVCSVKIARYWPRSFFASLWTSMPSRSIITQKKNEAHIQPSWPHTWSITLYFMPAQVVNHNAEFGSSLLLTELAVYCNNSAYCLLLMLFCLLHVSAHCTVCTKHCTSSDNRI